MLDRELDQAAFTLDERLPDIDGLRVLRRLKEDLATRHIPVQVISIDAVREEAVRHGAHRTIEKPVNAASLNAALSEMRRFVDRPAKDLLLVGRDDALRRSILETIGNGDVRTSCVADPQQALALLERENVDCVLHVLHAEDGEGAPALADLCATRELPLVVYRRPEAAGEAGSASLMTRPEDGALRVVSSLEAMFDETARLLHRCVARLPEGKRQLLEQIYQSSEPLKGRRVLIVDDDIRNIFAMTSLLEAHGMEVLSAETGPEALRLLHQSPNVDLILMDIMLPEMDGYETMRAIRRMADLRDLPIIALTAKAMKGDRDRCIEAGASDYISKPVETARLLATLRLWLTPQGEVA
jgi:CheY-like chemotaxis protein